MINYHFRYEAHNTDGGVTYASVEVWAHNERFARLQAIATILVELGDEMLSRIEIKLMDVSNGELADGVTQP